MKRFNLKKAKAGDEVITRSGKPAKILLFDRSSKTFPLVAIIENKNVLYFNEKGKFYNDKNSDNDLLML
jgi:hypothetical protein